MENLILTPEAWAEWRLQPITQKFLEYLRVAKYDIARQKMQIISEPVDKIDPALLAHLNGTESILTQLLTIKPQDVADRLSTAAKDTAEYKRLIKENLGVEL